MVRFIILVVPTVMDSRNKKPIKHVFMVMEKCVGRDSCRNIGDN